MHSKARHCPYSDTGTQTPVRLFIDGCPPKRLVLHSESQLACWSCGEENLKEAWVGDESWKGKKRGRANLLQREMKQMDSTERPNRTTAAYLSKSVLDKIVLLDFALGYLMSWLKQLQVNSYFSWGLVKNGRGFSWLENLNVVAMLDIVKKSCSKPA